MQATSKAPLATSKSRQTTSEGVWALFSSRCRYADDEYSNQFNISFAIVDIKCAQIYNKFEAKGICMPRGSSEGMWVHAYIDSLNFHSPAAIQIKGTTWVYIWAIARSVEVVRPKMKKCIVGELTR